MTVEKLCKGGCGKVIDAKDRQYCSKACFRKVDFRFATARRKIDIQDQQELDCVIDIGPLPKRPPGQK